MMIDRYDVAILGSSFSGSILAAVLASQGMQVLMLDRNHHPRFAIGESSTPTADFLLEAIARRWSLERLLPLARWGSWQQSYPHIAVGKKRGFSYFSHHPHSVFFDDEHNSNSLLVAASADDSRSDTHWLRAGVDQFLFQHAQNFGVATFEQCEQIHIEQHPTWTLQWQCANERRSRQATASWLIDSTGVGGAVAKAVGLCSQDDQLKTQTGALYAHFMDVGSWDDLQLQAGNATTVYPFRSDDAAQHHLMHEGWMWMLRFNNGCTSVGIVKPTPYWQHKNMKIQELSSAWKEELIRFPSLDILLKESKQQQPLRFQPRLSRIWSAASGHRWAMLPTTAGFVDPLHSSGIAHALSGVYRLASILLEPHHDHAAWLNYGRDVLDEIHWIDELVDACYTALPDFELFCMAANFYFVSAIDAERDFAQEQQSRAAATVYGKLPSFLASQNKPLRESIKSCIQELKQLKQQFLSKPNSESERMSWLESTRTAIGPWNHADMGNKKSRNRYDRSAAEK